MVIDSKKTVCRVDSGAIINAISEKHIKSKKVKPCKTRPYFYNGETIQAEGKAKLELLNSRTKKQHQAEFIIVKQSLATLIGKTTSKQIDLITVKYENFEEVAMVTDADIFKEYSDVFDDKTQGNLPGLAHLKVDTIIITVISPSCRVSYSMKEKVKSELEKRKEKSIITPVT